MLSRGEIFAEDDGERRVRPGLPATEIMDTIERVAVAVAENVVAPYSHTQPDFARHVMQRNRRTRLRRLVRGMAGILLILLAWQIMSRIFDLDLLLPPPLTVLRNVVVTLTVSNSHWLYGPNIYVHLSHSFLRATAGFVSAAVVAIPLVLLLGRITTLREFMMPAIQAVYPIPGIARIRLLFFGSVSAIPPSCSSCSRQCSFRCYSMLRPVHD